MEEEKESMLAACSENQGPMILAVSFSLLAIAIIAVLLRLHIRLGLRNGLSADDYTIVASLVSHTHSITLPLKNPPNINHPLDRRNHRNQLPRQTRPRRPRSTRLVPLPCPNLPIRKMEHHRPNLQHHRHRPR